MASISLINQKILDWDKAAAQCSIWRSGGCKVVFTNGCFDLIHYGHIHYLAEAAQQGDKLVIGLNADISVAELKGSHRPIKDEKNRAALLASLFFVDAVVVFKEITPLKLIQLIRPDVLVKGGDYSIDEIVGADFVLQNGGRVETLSFVEGYSTTALEQKIKSC